MNNLMCRTDVASIIIALEAKLGDVDTLRGSIVSCEYIGSDAGHTF